MQALSKIILFSLRTLKGKNYAKIVIIKRTGGLNILTGYILCSQR